MIRSFPSRVSVGGAEAVYTDRWANWNDSPTQATSRGTRVAYRYSPESSARPERLHATCPNIADLQFITDEKNFHAFQKEIDPDRG